MASPQSNVNLDPGLTLELGEHSYIHGSKIKNPSGALTHVTIGKFCSIATDLTLIGYDHHSEWITMFPFLDDGHRAHWPGTQGLPYPQASRFGSNKSRGDIVIGHDVWIGYDVKLFKGITIGNGAVIGACSLVNKSVAPYSIVAGIPARPIRKRFSDDQIARLELLQWWNLPRELIDRYLPRLCSSDLSGLEADLAQDPEYLRHQNQLQAKKFLLQADAAYGRQDLTSAIQALEQALALEPDTVTWLVCLGNLQFQVQRFAQALQSFSRAAQLQPDDSDILARLASTAHQCQESECFETNLQRALKLNPHHPLALRLSANLSLAQRRHAQAAEAYTRLLGKGTEDPELLVCLGGCLRHLGDVPSARWCYERARALDPDHPQAQAELPTLPGVDELQPSPACPVAA